jgi:spermidine synthase
VAGLFALSFGSGFAVMAIEVAGARVMAPVFGLSAVPWTAIIGVILAALAVGSHLGGVWADRGRPPLAGILGAGGLTALFPLLLSPVPRWAADALGFVPGALVAAALLFAPPVLALGAVVPYLVRAATGDLDHVGRWAGDMSAAATAGSIAGTFVTGFLLLPALPLPALLAGTAAAVFLLAILAARLLPAPGTPPVVVLVAGGAVAAWVGIQIPATAGEVIHREETVHGSIQVTDRQDASGRRVRELWQNGASSSAEVVASGAPAHPYARALLELTDPMVREADSVLVLGGGALTLPVALARRSPGVAVDVMELDPAVTRLAREYFAFGRSPHQDRIRVLHGDARRRLREAGPRYDLVILDVFDHLVTVPWTLVTVEALELTRSRMRSRGAPGDVSGGVLAANVLSPTGGDGALFLARFLATLETVFSEVRAHPVDPDRDPGAVQNVLVLAGGPASLPPSSLPTLDLRSTGPPLTDGYAPVEALQARVFLEGLRWR